MSRYGLCIEKLGHTGESALVLACDDAVSLSALSNGALGDGEPGEGYLKGCSRLLHLEPGVGLRSFSLCLR